MENKTPKDFWITDDIIYLNFNLTKWIWPWCENMEEDAETIEFNNRSPKEKFKLLEKLYE